MIFPFVLAIASSDVAPGLASGLMYSGGPDAFGYTFMDSDESTGPSFQWVDASLGTAYSMGDDQSILIGLPFEFPFYDTVLTQVYLVSNGYISGNRSADFSNQALPDEAKENLIAPFWDDLDPSSGGTVYVYYDSSGTGALVVEWENVPHFESGGPYTFELLLFPDGNILFQYLDMDEDLVDKATIGIQGGNGSHGFYLQYTYGGNPVVPHDSLAILFVRSSFDHNVGVDRVEPHGRFDAGDTLNIIAEVVNVGLSDETFDVHALVVDGDTRDTLFENTLNLFLPARSSAVVDFGQFIVMEDRMYDLTVFTTLNGDEYPDNDTLNAIFRTRLFMGDVIHVMDVGTITGDRRVVGVEYDGKHIYLTGANSTSDPNKVYVLDTTGSLLCRLDQPSHSTDWGWRDMAFDGDTFYASVDHNVDKFTIDVDKCLLTYHGNFPGPVNPNRALAYRPSDGHFFTANFDSDIYEFDRNGLIKNVWSNPMYIYGAAYDPVSHTVWFSVQELNDYVDYNRIYQFDPQTGNFTGVVLEPGPKTWEDVSYAGGMDFGVYDGHRVLLEILQAETDLLLFIYMDDVVSDPEGMRDGSFSISSRGNMLELQVVGHLSISLDVYSISGRRVFHLRRNFDPGTYRISAGDLPSGIYILRAVSDDLNLIRKIVIAR